MSFDVGDHLKFFGVSLEHKGDNWETKKCKPLNKFDWHSNEKTKERDRRDPSNVKVQESKVELLGGFDSIKVVIGIGGEGFINFQNFSGLEVDVGSAVCVVSSH